MSIFKTSLKVVMAHRLYILAYLVALSLLDLLTGATQAGSSSNQVRQATASVAVIDRNGSTISYGVRDYAESVDGVRSLEDFRRAIQGVTTQNRINYILIIPADYGRRLQEAIRQGTEPPRMDTVIGYESAAGSLMSVCVDSYLGQVADCLSTLTEDPARAVPPARGMMSHSTPAERITQDTTPPPYGLIICAESSICPIMAFAIVTISALMASPGRQAVRSRLAAVPVSSRSRNLGVMGACLVIGLIGWLWVFRLAVATFGASAATTSAPLLGAVGVAPGAYMLVAISLEFLMGQFSLGQNAANTVANIGGVALPFLAGAWVSIEWMLDAVAQAARLILGCWATQATSGVFTATSISIDIIGPLLANCGICALFAVVVFVVVMVVGHVRMWLSL